MSEVMDGESASDTGTPPVPDRTGRTAAGATQSPMARMWANRNVRTVLAVYAILIVLLALARFVKPSYGTFGFVRTVIGLSVFTAIVAFGQGIVILTGGFDLSIPSTMTLAGVLLTGLTLGSSTKTAWVIPLVLLTGTAIGFVNGMGVAWLRLPPIVMTLATNTILGGVVLVYTNGTPKGFTPKNIVRLAQGRIFGKALPEIIIVLIVFTIAAVLLLNATSFGRRVYAVGSNPIVARLSGVRVAWVLIAVYAISGLCSALGGMLLSGYSNQSYLSLGDPYLLLSLAAVVVGGATVRGGRGYYLGTVAGAIILTAVSTILAGTSLPEALRQIVYAAAIIIAVLAARQQQ